LNYVNERRTREETCLNCSDFDAKKLDNKEIDAAFLLVELSATVGEIFFVF